MTESETCVPALPYIVISDEGRHWIAGSRCRRCEAVMLGERLACPSCGDRHSLEQTRLGNRGTVHTWTAVHRSFGGIATPFLSVVIDLDGGGALRGTLVDFDPKTPVPRNLRVRVVFRKTEQRDKTGRPFLAYCFVPEEGSRP